MKHIIKQYDTVAIKFHWCDLKEEYYENQSKISKQIVQILIDTDLKKSYVHRWLEAKII